MRIPGITFVQGGNVYTNSDERHFGIAIHNTSNDASDENEATYAKRRPDGISSHFYADENSVTQSLDTNDKAGHAGSREGNEHAIAWEFTGANGKSRQWWLANIAWDEVGRVMAYLITNDPDYRDFEVRRASVEEMRDNPKVRAFYSHNDMRLAWGGTTHTDPGRHFPFDHLLEVVSQALGEDEDMPTVDEFWAKQALEYVDEDGNQVRDKRTVLDILYASHRAAVQAQKGVAALNERMAELDRTIRRLAPPS